MYDKDIRKDEDMKRRLIEMAKEKLQNSYAPYSNYNVAAAALFDSGKIYTGVNVESASLGMTVAIVGGTNRECNEYCVPCGACRQVMRDFGDKESMIVLSAKTPDDYLEHTLDELLPYSFGPESL